MLTLKLKKKQKMEFTVGDRKFYVFPDKTILLTVDAPIDIKVKVDRTKNDSSKKA